MKKNKSLLVTIFSFIFFNISAGYAGSAISLDATGSNLSAADQVKLNNFINEVESMLAEPILKRLSHNLPAKKGEYAGAARRLVDLKFTQISGEANSLNTPVCEIIDTMSKAYALKSELKQVMEKRGLGKRVRFDGQVHSYVQIKSASQATINLHAGFLPIILAGESAAATFQCGHKNMYRLAQAAVVHGVARIIDAARFQSQAEMSMIEGRNSQCAKLKATTANSRGKSDRINWSNGSLFCIDLEESETMISERNRYRILGSGWDGKKGEYLDSMAAFWPRAVNKYAYAYDVQNHFAHMFEFFVMDPQFACRMPNMHEHLVTELNDGTGKSVDRFQSMQKGLCKVNTKLRVVESFTNDMAMPYVDISWYDLNPQKVAGIDYFRAGAGSGAASLFGHSMFRVRGTTPDALVANCEEAKMGLGPCDLILNHRANPVELRLDQAKGFFGGYPSQLLITPLYDILYEYNDSGMRHIFNLALGQTNNGNFETMPEDEKRRFLFAAVEQYWTYVGDYKFISNNCADEAIRLYQNASTNPKLGYVNVLTPSQIDHKILTKTGSISKKDSESVKEAGLIRRMIRKVFGRSQKGYIKERRSMENNDLVELSKRYSFYDAISEIIRLEGRKIVSNNNGKKVEKTVDHTNINVIEDESAVWEKIGTVSEKTEDICKVNEQYADTHMKRAKVAEVLESIVSRYETVFGAARAEFERTKSEEAKNKMREINESFFVALYHADIMRQGQLGDISIRIAYEIARPDNGKEMICKGEKAWKVEPHRKQFIQKLLDEYEVYENLTQPYSEFSLVSGYGIPLENEIRPDGVINDFAERKKGNVMQLMVGLAPELGIDFDIYRGIRHYRYELCQDRLSFKLYNNNAPECDLYFEDVVVDRNNGRIPSVFKK